MKNAERRKKNEDRRKKKEDNRRSIPGWKSPSTVVRERGQGSTGRKG